MTHEEATITLARRLRSRETDFLALVRRTIYGYPGSPYGRLLEVAGCEYGDLDRLVRQEGLDSALRVLYRRGVYLTGEEFKGRRAVVRGSETLSLDPVTLRNPGLTYQVPVQTSGSGGSRTAVPIHLDFVRDRAVSTRVAYAARNGLGWTHAIWGVPGGAAMAQLLQFAGFGAAPARWFSQVDPMDLALDARYRWSAQVMRWGSLVAGVPLPYPQHVQLSDPSPILEWMATIRRAGGAPHVYGYASSVVRLCQAARAAGRELGGVHFTVGSEPVTAVRLDVIRGTGASAAPRYANTESGPIGYGCLAPDAPDEVHVLTDLHALIQLGPEDARPSLPSRALLISSIRPTTPLILLNVSLGDEGDVVQRMCGCPMERLGWTTHLASIRSFEKLTSEGMTFSDVDVIRILEEVLPQRFGGGPTDYQLVEDDSTDALPRIRLIVHPAIGSIDEPTVAAAFLDAVGASSGRERLMALHWRAAGLLRVERRTPYLTSSGKILHLHRSRAIG